MSVATASFADAVGWLVPQVPTNRHRLFSVLRLTDGGPSEARPRSGTEAVSPCLKIRAIPPEAIQPPPLIMEMRILPFGLACISASPDSASALPLTVKRIPEPLSICTTSQHPTRETPGVEPWY